jgi:hypothetical protein
MFGQRWISGQSGDASLPRAGGVDGAGLAAGVAAAGVVDVAVQRAVGQDGLAAAGHISSIVKIMVDTTPIKYEIVSAMAG